MTGNKHPKKKLNDTLFFIVKLLNDNNIDNWFIAYGTLLGIIREESCIDNDDDVDIICDSNDFNKLVTILKDNSILFDLHKRKKKYSVIKTKDTDKLASIDLYMGEIDKNGNYYEPQERIIWSECYLNKKLIQKQWNNIILNIPNNYEKKLIDRYGNDWKIPKNIKKFWVEEGVPKNKII